MRHCHVQYRVYSMSPINQGYLYVLHTSLECFRSTLINCYSYGLLTVVLLYKNTPGLI